MLHALSQPEALRLVALIPTRCVSCVSEGRVSLGLIFGYGFGWTGLLMQSLIGFDNWVLRFLRMPVLLLVLPLCDLCVFVANSFISQLYDTKTSESGSRDRHNGQMW